MKKKARKAREFFIGIGEMKPKKQKPAKPREY
jgi:hypothetical protein